MSENSSDNLPAVVEKNKGGRRPGTPKTGGRVKGSTNKIHAGILREMLLKKSAHIKAINVYMELLDDDDPKIRLAAAKEVTNRMFGKVQDEQANLDRAMLAKQLADARDTPVIQVVFHGPQNQNQQVLEAKVIDIENDRSDTDDEG